jgi:putative transposase
MPNYRRDYSGCLWFFTVVTHRRQHLFDKAAARKCLRESVDECRDRYPFDIPAWVLLPDHLHCIWNLPVEDRDYSRRWSLIKRRFTQRMEDARRCGPFWQARFWAHRIDDEKDFANHVAYIHYNPVRHGMVTCPVEWRWSTFHRYVDRGLIPADWGAGVRVPLTVGRE